MAHGDARIVVGQRTKNMTSVLAPRQPKKGTELTSMVDSPHHFLRVQKMF